MAGRGPPRIAEALLERLVPPEDRDAILGDLAESFHARPPGMGRRAWYWIQALLIGTGWILEGIRRPRGPGWTDIRIAVRGLRRRPGHAALVTGTVMLGAAAAAAGYGLLHDVLLKPLPWTDARELVALRRSYGGTLRGLTLPEYLAVAEQSGTLSPVAALVEPNLDHEWTWTDGERRRSLRAVRVTADFFTVLGTTPLAGTLDGAQTPGAPRLVLSHAFWQREFGGDPDAVGRSLRINGAPLPVSGILPSPFEFPLGIEPTGVWVVETPAPVPVVEGLPVAWRAIGRRVPGSGPDEVRAEVTRILGEVNAGLEGEPGRVVVRGLVRDVAGEAPAPVILLALSGLLVLIVAALNLSTLLSARTMERLDELVVRRALGATRGRLVGHLATEAGLLALVGGGLAAMLALGILSWSVRTRPLELARLSGDGAGPILVVGAVLAAVVPALLVAVLEGRRALAGMRKPGTRGSSGDPRQTRRIRVLTGLEAGVVFVLLVTGGLLLRTLAAVTSVDPGFEPAGAVAVSLLLPPDRYADDPGNPGNSFVETIRSRLEAHPDVMAAGIASHLPLDPGGWSGSLSIDGRPPPRDEGMDAVVDWELVDTGYFGAMGIPLRRGRTFEAADGPDAGPVVVIDEALERRWFPDGGAVGARISGGGPLRTVIGVVGSVRQEGLDGQLRGSMYLPIAQFGAPLRQELVVRSVPGRPTRLGDIARTAVLAVEPDAVVQEVRTLDRMVSASASAFRLRATLLSGYAALAMLLGMAGIYGVTAHRVRTRARDIGIRVAMGADDTRVVAGILQDALVPVLLGILGGAVILVVGSPALEVFLIDVAPWDPAVMMSVALGLLLAAGLAVLPPALRARRVDPARMLRTE